MEDFRNRCTHINSQGECPVFETYKKCVEIAECPLGETIVLQDYNKMKYGVDLTEVAVENFGFIDFGLYQGIKKWPDLPKKYLEYLLSPNCYTSQRNKNIAKKVLESKSAAKGQLESNLLKGPCIN